METNEEPTFVVKEAIVLKDGLYYGIVKKIEYRQEPYEYIDIFIEEEKTKILLKYGCPRNNDVITEQSKIGRLISNFTKLEIGLQMKPSQLLVGKKVSFMVQQVKSKKDGNFYAKIVDDSIKPFLVETKVN